MSRIVSLCDHGLKVSFPSSAAEDHISYCYGEIAYPNGSRLRSITLDHCSSNNRGPSQWINAQHHSTIVMRPPPPSPLVKSS